MTKAKLYFTTGDPQEIDNLEVPNLNVSGITTLGVTTVTKLTAQEFNISGITTLGATAVSDLTSQQFNVSGISTFANGPVFVGSATTTGTSSQSLQVTGGAYVSGSIGIGTTNPTKTLDVNGDTRITGILTAGQYNITTHVPISNQSFTSASSNGTVSGTFTLPVKSNCLFSFNGTSYKSSGTNINLTLSVTGVGNLATVFYYTNEINSHKSSPTGYANTTLSAGTWTVVITSDSNTDGNDKGNCSVLAIPTL